MNIANLLNKHIFPSKNSVKLTTFNTNQNIFALVETLVISVKKTEIYLAAETLFITIRDWFPSSIYQSSH